MALDARPQCLSVLYVGGLPPHPGGAAISAAGLLTGLAALGHTVRAPAASRCPPASPAHLA